MTVPQADDDNQPVDPEVETTDARA
jgi:hypothetical protein